MGGPESPVDWNVIPGVLDFHVVPRYDGRCDVGEGPSGAEEEDKEPVVWHE